MLRFRQPVAEARVECDLNVILYNVAGPAKISFEQEGDNDIFIYLKQTRS